MLIYTTWLLPQAHPIKVSTGKQQKVEMILVIGCVWILLQGCSGFEVKRCGVLDSSLTTHQYIDKGMFSTHYSKYCKRKTTWDIPISKLRLVNGCSDNPKPLRFIRALRISVLRSSVATWSYLGKPWLQRSPPAPQVGQRVNFLTASSFGCLWKGHDPSIGPSKHTLAQIPMLLLWSRMNVFILAQLPICFCRLPVGRPWHYRLNVWGFLGMDCSRKRTW